MACDDIIGTCLICGKHGKLTFEHIPPKKANNSKKARMIKSDEMFKILREKKRVLFDTDGLQYKELQKGVGKYSLCERCNNLTGTYYGTEYTKFARTIQHIYSELGEIKVNESLYIELIDFYPLRFAKQVLSLFCSTTQGLVKNVPEIRELILDKNKNMVDTKKFKLSMYLLAKQRISYTGLNAILKGDGTIETISEICAYPFGFALELNPKKDNQLLNITSFLTDFNYNDKAEVEMYVGIRERNSILPLDFRSVDELNKTREK